VTAETFAGRVHLEWEPAASVTTMGQLAFFIEYLKQTDQQPHDLPLGDRDADRTPRAASPDAAR
jgi:hypothetical protein